MNGGNQKITLSIEWDLDPPQEERDGINWKRIVIPLSGNHLSLPS